MADIMDKQVRQKMLKKSTLNKELKPSEVAKKIVFLCSDRAIKLNGHILKFSGN